MYARKIAIACQGGGTHAAFTWGVLTEILKTKKAWDERGENAETFDLVAISGTSAGALCALATWYGLTPNLADADCGTIDKAIERLDSLWTSFAATTPIEHIHNSSVRGLLHLMEKGVPFPASNPYDGYSDLAMAGLALLGARQEYLGFPGLLEALCPHFSSIDWPKAAQTHFRMLVGAIEVLSGNVEVFDSEKTLREMGLPSVAEDADQYGATRWRMRRSLTMAGVAASGTLPEVLQAQKIEDLAFPTCEPGEVVRRNGYYWDGLYSQNPPVHDLLDVRHREDKPDEIWVIRINPQEYFPKNPNVQLHDIHDRVNALAGNLSLNQELDHILTINRWISEYGDGHPPLNKCKLVDVRTIKMTGETARRLRSTSKFDRSPSHIEMLRDEGQTVAKQWLRDWRALGRDFAAYPNDARYPESKPTSAESLA
jgi:NTE family protein